MLLFMFKNSDVAYGPFCYGLKNENKLKHGQTTKTDVDEIIPNTNLN